MAFFKRTAQSIRRRLPASGILPLAGLRSFDGDDLFQKLEEFAAGLGLAAVACWGTEFLPYWSVFIALALAATALITVDKHFPVFSRTSLTLITIFVALSQPWAAFLAILGLSGGAAYICYERLYNRHVTRFAPVAVMASAVVTYVLMTRVLLPLLHPLTVVLYNCGPLIAVACGVLTSLYCAWRMRSDIDDRLFYKLAPGICAVLFALFFPMKNSWVGLGAEWLFAVGCFAIAFKGPRPLLIGGTTVGAVFGAAFLLLNGWTFMHEVAMAESMNVHEVQRLPETHNNRIMPVVVGRDFCVQGNDATMTETGEPHALIMDGTYYWQCPTHYTGFQLNHLFSWIPGSTAGFVMVNAGTTASDTRVNDRAFLFGENSGLVKSAFEARHPNGTMAGFTYAADRNGNYYLLLPYTTNQLFWGAMVPTLGGVMAVSPWGFVEDYTVSQAASAFPGTFLYPSELARQYAEVWGKRTIGKLLSRSFLEVSEPAPAATANQSPQDKLSNPLPYGIDTSEGRKYFVPYEPQGKSGTALTDVAFFDGATGDSDVEILHVADSNESGDNSALGHRSIQGPKELLEKSANVVQGHFQLTAIEPIIVVSRAGRIYFITANMGPDKSKSNHDYQGDTLSFATGEPQWVITSGAEADSHIQEHEKLLDGGDKPALPAAAQGVAPSTAQGVTSASAPGSAPSTTQGAAPASAPGSAPPH